jgi:hypothetical protein
MRRISFGLLALTLLASPVAARAGFLVEASVGSGVRAGIGTAERIPTNVMGAIGYGFTDMLKLEVGALASLGDAKAGFSSGGSRTDVDLRGMVVISPPLFPLYLRGIAGVTSLKVKPARFTYGAALGVGFGLFGVGAFGEVGAMQHRYEVTVPVTPATPSGTVGKDGWQLEGRIGISIG